MEYCKVCEEEVEEPTSCDVCGAGGLCEDCAAECEQIHEEEVYD